MIDTDGRVGGNASGGNLIFFVVVVVVVAAVVSEAAAVSLPLVPLEGEELDTKVMERFLSAVDNKAALSCHKERQQKHLRSFRCSEAQFFIL